MEIDRPEDQNSETKKNSSLFQIFFILLEVVIVILYGIFVEFRYDPVDPSLPWNEEPQTAFVTGYPVMQDVSVMMFIGFGFLMTFLRTHSWSAVGFNFILTVVVFQMYILYNGFWIRCVSGDNWDFKIQVDITTMVTALYCCAAILISLGGVLGKLNLFQLLVMAFIEACFYALNEAICFDRIHLQDIGGSITIHTFGAYFGLSVTMMISPKQTKGHPKNSSNYNSNLFAMIGTLFLWMYWPSFNCFPALNPEDRIRSVINTLLALTGSTTAVFITSSIFKKGKLSMEDVLNATLAGGVCVGTSADQIVYPFAALFVGYWAGFMSCVGFEVLSPLLQRKIGLYDTCGINNLHGMPGIFGGIFSAIFIGALTEDTLGYRVEDRFDGRTASEQGGLQIASLGITLAIAIITGVITGLILKLPCFNGPHDLFEDQVFWEMDEHQVPNGYIPTMTRELITEGMESPRKHKHHDKELKEIE
ncbi:unnamed protein product [Blepharisma stoltei]|uniref:Ammonium transporter AmtB-like domain-containing protein n=1 Tax=Blepharisma stoltei TaxID=1481888 RepID=A0AAU9JUR4_9CILI|nr:unnamed protein product [Blepharisma stoltei]